MKASELRIGNYITDIWAHKNSYFQVKQIGEKHLWYGLNSSDSFKALNDNIRPIPITEDWLVKFSFSPIMGIGCITNDYILEIDEYNIFKILLRHEQNRFNKVFIFIINEDLQPIIVEFVHQLQNLYFALTGDELTLK